MNRLAMVSEMLTLQDGFNQVVNPQWRQAGLNWSRAVWVECGELMDHFGYKWWKASQPDMGQCVLEVVDIWHFVMSHEMTLAANEQVARDVAQLLEFAAASTETVCTDDERRACIDRLAMRSAAFAGGQGASLLVEFLELADAFGLDMEQLFLQYIGKNALNRFRQRHGYKQGTYKKQWNGREDNEVLAEVLQNCLAQGEADLMARVLTELESLYLKL
ncbi:MAG: dUTP diphosphatase [Burkholderiales bacterium]|nr:dUTP diphosphatase [Burkholderiales bacterium]